MKVRDFQALLNDFLHQGQLTLDSEITSDDGLNICVLPVSMSCPGCASCVYPEQMADGTYECPECDNHLSPEFTLRVELSK